MARATNGNAATFAGDGAVWFKVSDKPFSRCIRVLNTAQVHEVSAVTDGGNTITWPAESAFPEIIDEQAVNYTRPLRRPRRHLQHPQVSPLRTVGVQSYFQAPSTRPPMSARYLVRMEAIALHSASTLGGGKYTHRPHLEL